MKTLLKKSTILITILTITFSGSYRIAEAAPACPLSQGDGEYIVNFSGKTIFSNADPKSIKTTGLNIPAGTYNLTAVTYDNHSAHGGQGQKSEIVKFAAYGNSVKLFQTGATTDIAEGSDFRTTTFSKSFTASSAINVLLASHAAAGTPGYQSVTPLCVKLSPVTTNTATLTASCNASPSSVKTGDTVTWDANASGGNGTYTYSWSGADTNGKTTENFTKTYSTTGSRTATVTVTSGGQTATASCSVNVTDTPNPPSNNFDVSCNASDRTIDVGETVTFTANVTGGNSPFDFDWNGDTRGEDDNDNQIRVRYNSEGRYYVSVTVRDDDGRTRTDSCPVVVVNEDDNNDDFDIQCKVSDTSIKEGDRVRFEVDIDGGNSPYDINWSGDTEGEDEDDEDSFYVRYDRDGRYEVDVRVRDDDGRTRTDSCPVVRVSNDDDDNNIRVITNTSNNPPTGNLSSLNSVFLSQIPYTGPEEIMKGIGFVAGLLIFTTLASYMLRSRRRKNAVSQHISDFKESNKKANSIA